MRKMILPGFRYGFTPGYVIVSDKFNEATGNKDIQEYYNGVRCGGHSECFTENINAAEFYSAEKSARNHAMLLTYNIPGTPGVFCRVISAHIEVIL